jgi:pimeloyl-ACP methyl ester carboxylesterase
MPTHNRVTNFCLIHGAWHDPSCWDVVVERLAERGHRAVAPDLPLHDPEAGFKERARPALDALEDLSGPLVIVGHSQGSAYSSLAAASRPDLLLVHLCPRLGGFRPPPGAPETFRRSFRFPAERPDGTSVWDPDDAIREMYPRLAPEVARALAQRLRPMVPPPDAYPLTAHPDVPTAFIYAADDELFEPAWERFMARELVGVEPIEIPGGHFPMAEDPVSLAYLLDRLTDVSQPRAAAGS